MLCRKFELIPIKIGFFMNSKSWPKTMYYSSLAKRGGVWLCETRTTVHGILLKMASRCYKN